MPWRFGLFFSLPLIAQTTQTPYSMSVSVNEVTLSFHASDAHGLPIDDLKLADLQILDNGLAPSRVSAFRVLRDTPTRAGIVFDTSTSMMPVLNHNREVALAYAQSVVRKSTDQVFIASFASISKTIQPWTNDSTALAQSLRRISGYGERVRPGTAIYDSLYQTCRTQFGGTDKASSGNFILLFSDGEDNASRYPLSQAIESCQHNHVAIYAFRTGSDSGALMLEELAEKTGGEVFHYPENSPTPMTVVSDDLRLIERAQRSQYQLTYVPSIIHHDGSFHHVQVTANDLQDHIEIRSGYYAPSH
jgi:Ca-activated chloride channel family protein